jgi:hypothetical protein
LHVGLHEQALAGQCAAAVPPAVQVGDELAELLGFLCDEASQLVAVDGGELFQVGT